MSNSPSFVHHPIQSHGMDHGYTYGVETHERHCEDYKETEVMQFGMGFQDR